MELRRDLDLGYYVLLTSISQILQCHHWCTHSEVLRKWACKASIWERRSKSSNILQMLSGQDQAGSTGRRTRIITVSVAQWLINESLPFLEAFAQMKADVGADNVMYNHTTLPALSAGSWRKEDRQLSILSKSCEVWGFSLICWSSAQSSWTKYQKQTGLPLWCGAGGGHWVARCGASLSGLQFGGAKDD